MKLTMKLAAALIVFVLGSLSLKAQDIKSVTTPKDKKKIELRPNSRDYGSVKRDNLGKRIDRTKDRNLFVKKRPAINRKFIKPNNNRDIQRDQRIHRQQRVIQRRSINR